MTLSKDQILAADDLHREELDIPEWKGSVFVRVMTGKERDQFESEVLAADNDKSKLVNIRSKLCALTVCDEQGQRLFTDQELESLGGKSAAALERIFILSQKLNLISDKDVEELEKN